MSIWSSHEEIECLSYATGWSNHYPTRTGDVERQGATVDLASIPPWCVPGHEDADEGNDPEWRGPWIRLGVSTQEHDWHNPHVTVGEMYASVVMDEDAVRSLRDQLTEWLNAPKLYPIPQQPKGNQ